MICDLMLSQFLRPVEIRIFVPLESTIGIAITNSSITHDANEMIKKKKFELIMSDMDDFEQHEFLFVEKIHVKKNTKGF